MASAIFIIPTLLGFFYILWKEESVINVIFLLHLATPSSTGSQEELTHSTIRKQRKAMAIA
jgi:hypothetical protein